MDIKDLLSTLVSHDSVFGNERSLAEWTHWYLAKIGFKVKKIPVGDDRFSILAERGKGKSKILCYAHLDTVPTYHGWNTDPLAITQKGDKLYGLGTCDMKGGMAALLFALSNLPQKVPLKLFFAIDEENDSDGSWTLVKQHPRLIAGITHMLSVEPGASSDKAGGADVLTLGRRGRARFIIKVQGYSAHGGHVERGINAVVIAADIVKHLETLKIPKHPRLGSGSHFIARIEAAAKGISNPEYCEIEIDRHLVIPETTESCLKQYQKICDQAIKQLHVPAHLKKYVFTKVELKKRKHDYMKPYETLQNDPFVKKARRAILAEKGRVNINYGRSVGDENIFASELGIKPIIVGPEGGNLHSPNEWVSLNSMEECSRVYQGLLLETYKDK